MAALHRIFVEAQDARELEQLRRIANELGVLIVLRHEVMRADSPEREPKPWNAFSDAKDLLAAYLEAVPAEALAGCRRIADPGDARLADTQLETDAKVELKSAFAEAGERLHASLAAQR